MLSPNLKVEVAFTQFISHIIYSRANFEGRPCNSYRIIITLVLMPSSPSDLFLIVDIKFLKINWFEKFNIWWGKKKADVNDRFMGVGVVFYCLRTAATNNSIIRLPPFNGPSPSHFSLIVFLSPLLIPTSISLCYCIISYIAVRGSFTLPVRLCHT